MSTQLDLLETDVAVARWLKITPLMSHLEVRARILELESYLYSLPSPLFPEDLPTKHVFAPGVYTRTVFMKKGEIWIGRIHKTEHVSIISQGVASVVTEFGAVTHRAFESFTSPPGTKRALVILEDTIWTCVHPNPDNIHDVEILKKIYTTEDYSEIGLENPQLGELSWFGQQ